MISPNCLLFLSVLSCTAIANTHQNDRMEFRKSIEMANVDSIVPLDCSEATRSTRRYEVAKHRPTLEPVSLGWSCASIQKRILPPRNPNTGFPILYARIVYDNYQFLEDQLATNYASENIYCFALDRKAPRTFHDRFFQLEKCLPNVVVARRERDDDSAGHNQNQAHLDCMKLARNRTWEYAVLMQNQDVLIKTHGEMTEILKINGGANDVDSDFCPDHRCISSLERNLGKLKLCPKNLTDAERFLCEHTDIEWGKGAMQAIISRAASDFIFDEIDVHPLIKEMNSMGYGVDEQLYNSININPEIRLPGRFHYKCRGNPQPITRVAQRPPFIDTALGRIWRLITFIFTGSYKYCPSGKLRHGSCIYGVEDLPFLAESTSVMANKMLPDFDQAVTSCISELLFNRTRDGPTIDKEFDANINAVRYHHERNNPDFNIDQFKC